MLRAASLLLLLTLLIGPAQAYASSLPAGFAPGAVWLSSHTPVGGDKVELYTVVYNASDTAIEGSVAFHIDERVVDSAPFTLSGGESKVRSVEWEAVPGEHSLVAVLNTVINTKTKELASVESTRTATTSFAVSAPEPKPTREGRTPIVVPAALSALTSNPLIASILDTTTESAEGIRTVGETFLTSYVATESVTGDAQPTENDGEVLGTTTIAREKDSSIAASAANAALPLFAYPALFYPFFLIILLFILWLVTRQLRNPKRRRRR